MLAPEHRVGGVQRLLRPLGRGRLHRRAGRGPSARDRLRGRGRSAACTSCSRCTPRARGAGRRSSWTAAGAKVFDNAVGYALGASFGAVAGTVTDAGGAPLPAKVTVVETGETATAAADGRYRLLLPPGEHTLRFERIGYTTEEHVVEVDGRETTTLDVELASSGAGGITGVVTSAAGGPVAGAEVSVLDTGLAPATTGADGAVLARRRPGRHLRVEVRATERFRPPIVEGVVVVDGAATELDVELDRLAARRGDRRLRQQAQRRSSNANEVEATATGWEAVANLDDYDVLVVNKPTDPGETAFREHLDAIDAAGKSAIFTEGARVPRAARGCSASTSATPTHATSSRPTATVLRPAVAGHPLFAGVAATGASRCSPATSGAPTSTATRASGSRLRRQQAGTSASAPPTSRGRRPACGCSCSALASSSLARPAAGWTDDGRPRLPERDRWAAAPGLGSVAGRVADAAGEPIAARPCGIVETGTTRGRGPTAATRSRTRRATTRRGERVRLPDAEHPGDDRGERRHAARRRARRSRTSAASPASSRAAPDISPDGTRRQPIAGADGRARRLPAQRDDGGGRLVHAGERRAGDVHDRGPRRAATCASASRRRRRRRRGDARRT